MNNQQVLRILSKVGAVISDSHIVYTSGKHGTAYVNKDAVYPHTVETSRLCRAIAERFEDDNVKVVIAPAIGGVILSQWIAHYLSEMNSRRVFGVYAEKVEESLHKAEEDEEITITVKFRKGDELMVKKPEFVIKRGYDKLIAGKRVLVAEDVLTTGGSAKKVVEAVRTIGGNVVGLGVLCNRDGITPQDVADVPKLTALANVNFDAYDEKACPLCNRNVPINTDVGKGREFLARKRQ